MCTVVLLRRPGHRWPLRFGANRDERLDRPWDPPAAWWPDFPGVVGGRDRLAGGTWMALGRTGIVAAVLNRPGSLGPGIGKRSRGDLPLLAAAAPDAAAAVERIGALPADEWRPFNMVIADSKSAWFVRGDGTGRPAAFPLPDGVSMVTAHDPNDLASARTARHLPRFLSAQAPDPDAGDWREWAALLADDTAAESLADALRVPPTTGFGTVGSSLLALAPNAEPIWLFAPVLAGSVPIFGAVETRAVTGA